MDTSQLGVNIASLANFGLYESIAKTRELGFQTIELLAFAGARHSQGDLAGFWFNKLSEPEKEQMRDSLSDFRHIAVHLPFIDTPLFSYNQDICRLSREQVKIGIDALGFLGGEAAVIHVNRQPFFSFQEYWTEMIDTFRDLGDYCTCHKIRLCIETMMPDSFNEFVSLIRDINHPHVGAAIDVGHIGGCDRLSSVRSKFEFDEAAKRYNDCLIELVEILGEKNFHFHIHDVRAEDWRDHRQPGTGIVDFKRLFNILEDINYTRLLTFELEEPDIVESLTASKIYIEKIIKGVG